MVQLSKKSSRGITKPREIDPLPLVDEEGNVQKWNLISRWEIGDINLHILDGIGIRWYWRCWSFFERFT